MALSEAQQLVLAIVPKITGFVSLLFSGLVILTVCVNKEKRSKTYHRLLFGISCVDVSSSFWLGLSTWPIPEETGIKWASGTTATCNVQAFFTQFGIASSFYNASLSVFFLLVIRYGWREDQLRKVEPCLHGFPLLWGLSTAIAGVPLTIFNSANLWCWIAPYQDRGANADVFRWFFFYGPLWIMICIVTINSILIFHHVLRIESKSARYASFQKSKHVSRHFRPDLQDGPELIADQAVMGTINEEKGNSVGDSIESDGKRIERGSQTFGDTTSEEIRNSMGGLRDSDIIGIETGSQPFGGSILSSARSGLWGALSFRESRKREATGGRCNRSREVAYQSLRFAGCFYFTWIALTVGCYVLCIDGDLQATETDTPRILLGLDSIQFFRFS